MWEATIVRAVQREAGHHAAKVTIVRAEQINVKHATDLSNIVLLIQLHLAVIVAPVQQVVTQAV